MVMEDLETMMKAVFPAYPMSCNRVVLWKNTSTMLHQTTELKGMATLILNLVSSNILGLKY